jgi:putative ABC transport system ATP-binding protein
VMAPTEGKSTGDETPAHGVQMTATPPQGTPAYGTPVFRRDTTAEHTGNGKEPLLELDEVSRIFGEEVQVFALRDVSLRIMPGDFMSIVGPSGSGKSTMLGILGVLDLPSAGVVRIAGQDVAALDDLTRSRLRGDSIGFVFQQFHLIPYLSALGNVETALLYRDIRPAERKERAFAALSRLGLGARADHRPVQLSGGEQQRVALARAIVTDPHMILADEPTGALDSKNAAQVLDIFQGLQAPERAVVMVTHDHDVAAVTHRQITMSDGQIVADELNASLSS